MICPFSEPRCRRGCTGTSFTTGSLLRAMMTSSAAIACSISFESCTWPRARCRRSWFLQRRVDQKYG
jgi:hypothetical protein